jgi:hypothetical protein
MAYPEENEIRRKLRPFKVLIWLFSMATLCLGAYLQLCSGIDDAFEKSGSLLLAVTLVIYFLLDRFDYLTGHPAENFDSAGHILPKKVMAFTEVSVATIGALIALFGNWVLSQLSEYLPC